MTGLIPALSLGLPWAALRAPVELGTGGAAWFEITKPGNPDAVPVATSTDTIWEWVDAHVDPAVRIIPIGFSQGGLTASQLLRTRPERVLATVILGGFVLGAPQPSDSELAASLPPVFWGRGAQDRVISADAVQPTRDYLPRHSALVEQVYPGPAHGISAEEIREVTEFVSSRLAASQPARH